MKIPKNEPTFYGLADWTSDYDWYSNVTLELGPASTRKVVPEDVYSRYFLSRYDNLALAEHHAKRFSLAMTYLELHLQDFDTGNLAVVGSEKALVSDSVICTLWVVFGNSGILSLNDSPPIKDIVSSAIENDRLLRNK